MEDRIIAIGDIHGCAVALRVLLEAIDVVESDTIVSLGDLVDRGPDSKAAIDQLLELRSRCKLVLVEGNHEEMMLAVVRGGKPPHEWLKHGGVSTLDSYGFSGDLSVVPDEHVAFMESALPFYETDSHFFVHGNYSPKVPLEKQDPAVTRWRSLIDRRPGRMCPARRRLLATRRTRAGRFSTLAT